MRLTHLGFPPCQPVDQTSHITIASPGWTQHTTEQQNINSEYNVVYQCSISMYINVIIIKCHKTLNTSGSLDSLAHRSL